MESAAGPSGFMIDGMAGNRIGHGLIAEFRFGTGAEVVLFAPVGEIMWKNYENGKYGYHLNEWITFLDIL
ncbi:unnamed protein product [Larinioides sclopetarius]|uniref:Uncharacterized protein n=1 Tax=Larinioides sclopetarius TaxID=280406 RepID=A0AAV2AZX5_9ARAC